ncbi:hypothetical protein AB4342_06995 [Vibrio breoganii]
MKSAIATGVQATLAVSIFYLGYSIHSVINKVDEVVEHFPVMVTQLDELSGQLKIDDWLTIADAVNEQLPEMVKIADQATKAIESTNKTIASIDEKIPQIQKELTLYRETVIPSTQKELQAYRETVVPPLLIESKQYREQTIPAVLVESQALRKDVPVVIASVDELLDKSQDLGREASKGAVKGVILSPVDILMDTGKQVVGNDEE